MRSIFLRATVLAACFLTACAFSGCAPKEPPEEGPVTKPNFTVNTAVPEGSSLNIPDLIGEKAVLQQNSVVRFWGTCSEDGPVAVCVNDTYYYGTCTDGAFELLIRTGAASKNNTVTVYTQKEKKTIRDIWFGEVFLCAGQSNMQLNFADIKAMPQQIPRDVRVATVPVLGYDEPVTRPITDAKIPWMSMADAVRQVSVSVVGFYFAQKMEQELGCPVGIVVCAAGDTIVASWLPEDRAAALPPVYQEVRKPYWVRTASHAYNTLLSPILKGTFKSVLWYQGENQSYQYDTFLKEMITCWREKFEKPDLHFTIIELVGCGDSWIQNWPEIRAMQRQVCRELDNCTLTVNIDLGEKFNIHPADKEPVGLRAAYDTLNALYDGKYPVSPVLQEIRRDGSTLRLTFSNDAGMVLKDISGSAFEVSADGRAWYGAKAQLDGTTVVLTYDEGLTPTAVRYAWANYSPDTAVLFNGDAMPADSFLVSLDDTGYVSP